MTNAIVSTEGVAQVTSTGGTFSKSVVLPAPPEAVFALCTSRSGFEAHFPNPVKDYQGPEAFSLGCTFTFKYRMNGLWLPWKGEVVEWEANRRFADEQKDGLFKRFVHTHLFEPMEGGKTLYTDRIEFAFGIPLKATQWITGKMIGSIFKRRHEMLAGLFAPGGPSTPGETHHA